MPTSLACPKCKKRFKAGADRLQKKIACPACGAAELAPAAKPSQPKPSQPKAAKAPPRLTAADIEAAFSGSPRPVRAGLLYRLTMLLAIGMLVLVPLVYLAIVAGVGAATYYHAVNHTGIMTSVRPGRVQLMALVVYAGPIVAGAILLVFMLKPLLPRFAGEHKSRSLVRENEPVLFALIDRVCEAVRAPKPRRVDVNCEVNAYASLRSGFASFLGGDLVLTIGMPLLAGLTTRQFAGVLAHEFGHFSQGAGMRLSYVLISLNRWLSRTAYQRDAWDDAIASAASGADLRLGWILYLAMGVIWLARKLLGLLLHLSVIVVGFVLRQMEYDADRYESRVAGAETFPFTSERMERLSAAAQISYQQLESQRAEGELVDDLPALIVLNDSRLPEGLVQAIRESHETGVTGWFDTHPSARDRIASVRRDASEGVFTLEAPARLLLRNYEAQCQASSWEFYREALGDSVRRDKLRPVAQVHEENVAADESNRRLYAYTAGSWRPRRRIGVDRECLTPAPEPKQTAAALKESRQRFESLAPARIKAIEKIDQTEAKIAQSHYFEALHRGEFRFGKNRPDAPYETREACVATRKAATRSTHSIVRKLEPSDAALRDRLSAALALAMTPAVTKQRPDLEERRARVEPLVKALLAIEGQLDTINTLRDESVAVGALVDGIRSDEGTESLGFRIEQVLRTARPRLEQLRDVLSLQPYPFKQKKRTDSLGAYLVPGVPGPDDLVDLAAAIDASLDRITATQHRLLVELAEIAERIETALKLPPMPSPEALTAAPAGS